MSDSKNKGQPSGPEDFFLVLGIILFGGTGYNMLQNPRNDSIEDWIYTGIAALLVYAFAKRRGWIGASEPKRQVPVKDYVYVPPTAEEPPAVAKQPGDAPQAPQAESRKDILFRIKLGRPRDWNGVTASAFMQTLMKELQNSFVKFSIESYSHGTYWILFVSSSPVSLDGMQRLVKVFYPDADVEEGGLHTDQTYPVYRKTIVFSRSDDFAYFEYIRTAKDVGLAHDPISAIVAAMDTVRVGEHAAFSIFWYNTVQFDEDKVKNLLTMSKLEAGQLTPRYYRAKNIGEQIGEDIVRTWLAARTRVNRYSPEDEKRYRVKLTNPSFVVVVQVLVESSHPERLTLASALTAAANEFNSGATQMIREGHTYEVKIDNVEQYLANDPSIVSQWYKSGDSERIALANKHIFYFTAAELATLWHLPHKGFASSKLDWSGKTQVKIPKALESVTDGTIVGFNRFDGSEHPVRIADSERKTHMLITGKAGTGKSSLLHNLIHQDIERGHGLCVIDPHGTLVDAVLQYSIPEQRKNDVVVLDISNDKHPPPLNPLYTPDGVESDISANLFMSVLVKMYPELVEQETGDTLANALLLLTAEDSPTLLDLVRVFDDVAYRHYLLDRSDDFTLKLFWKHFEAQASGQQALMVRPVLRRIRTFFRNKTLRAITCNPASLDIHHHIANNRIILVSLRADAAKVPEIERQVLGAILVSQIYMATLAGAVKRDPFVLYIDETERMATSALPEMLSEARKAGLGVVMAHQYLDQLPPATLNAVSGNVGTLLCLEVGEESARFFAPYMKPEFMPSDLLGLGLYRGALSMRLGTERLSAFTVETEKPLSRRLEATTEEAKERGSLIRQASIDNYTPKTYSQIIEWLKHKYDADDERSPTDKPDTNDDDDDQVEPKP